MAKGLRIIEINQQFEVPFFHKPYSVSFPLVGFMVNRNINKNLSQHCLTTIYVNINKDSTGALCPTSETVVLSWWSCRLICVFPGPSNLCWLKWVRFVSSQLVEIYTPWHPSSFIRLVYLTRPKMFKSMIRWIVDFHVDATWYKNLTEI